MQAADEDGTLRTPVALVSELIAAVSDGRAGDVLALVDPGVVCLPATRPARTVYEGHAGMIQLMADLSAAYGRHRIELEDISQETSTQVTALTRIVQESGDGNRLAGRVRSVYTIRSGLVAFIESDPVPGSPGTEPGRMHADPPGPAMPV